MFARVLEIISPAGFKNYFRELGAELISGKRIDRPQLAAAKAVSQACGDATVVVSRACGARRLLPATSGAAPAADFVPTQTAWRSRLPELPEPSYCASLSLLRWQAWVGCYGAPFRFGFAAAGFGLSRLS